MKKLFLFIAMIELCLVSAAWVETGRGKNEGWSSNVNVSQITSAPFRDGLYLGKLAAKQGGGAHIASGRWAAQADRLSFTAGFQQGYQEGSVHLASNANPNEK
jgi:hypothetical protein